MLMGIDRWFATPTEGLAQTILSEVNQRLSVGRLSISREDALRLAEGRAAALAELGRLEFGAPAIVEIAGAVSDSACLIQADAAETLAGLQSAFYNIREELPPDVPDAEIVEALRGCLDEWGDVDMVASMPAEEVMRYSKEYACAIEVENRGEYRIIDDEGRVYAFDPDEWDYDEHSDGWDGERWIDDWND